MEAPNFIDFDPQQIRDDIKSDYEDLTGRTLQPGQVEQLLINAFAYREYLLRIAIQDAATQNLVQFSRAPMLDYLGQLVGVTRLSASAAVVPIKLILVDGHEALIIPSGIRVQSIDGTAVFTLDNDVNISAGDSNVVANFTCTQTGTGANGYTPGNISVILDPQPYLISAENTETSTGGADDETDDELRKRIMLAPQSFSNAGSEGAYRFYAMSANTGIADIGITSPMPGQVNIYPLMQNGELPNQTILDDVFNACNGEKIRPLTDTVIVAAPTVVNYSMDIAITTLTGYVDSDVVDAVNVNLQAYANSRKGKLGLDVVIEKIIGETMKVEGVYDVTVNQPTATKIVNNDEVAVCTGITINVSGSSDE